MHFNIFQYLRHKFRPKVTKNTCNFHFMDILLVYLEKYALTSWDLLFSVPEKNDYSLLISVFSIIHFWMHYSFVVSNTVV